MSIRFINQKAEKGALVLIRDVPTDIPKPDGLGGYLDESRDLLGIIVDVDDGLVTVETHARNYDKMYAMAGSFNLVVIDSDVSYEDALEAIHAFNRALGIGSTNESEPFAKYKRFLNLVAMAEATLALPDAAKRKYDVIFSEIAPQVRELNMEPDYYDPDTTYEEDARAYVDALREQADEIRPIIEAHDQTLARKA
ncbi:MAG: hypothetical protein R3346_04155 [Candidatus Spechtbacterales bacterium]|nr:hypothetical protein [Candidatus Spechtbacterales bacterium]